jgi:hypothetical protein
MLIFPIVTNYNIRLGKGNQNFLGNFLKFKNSYKIIKDQIIKASTKTPEISFILNIYYYY